MNGEGKGGRSENPNTLVPRRTELCDYFTHCVTLKKSATAHTHTYTRCCLLIVLLSSDFVYKLDSDCDNTTISFTKAFKRPDKKYLIDII